MWDLILGLAFLIIGNLLLVSILLSIISRNISLKSQITLKQTLKLHLSRYEKEVCNFLEFMQNGISIVFTFFIVSISRFFPMLPIFPLRDFQFINFNISFLLSGHNGNKILQLFCAIPVAIVFLYIYVYFVKIFLFVFSLHNDEVNYLSTYSLNVRRKFFVLLHQNFVQSSNTLELVQEMQANSIIISNYDSLCYGIEPKVNKELSLNLLESMLELLVKVRMFSCARDIKDKHKVKNKKAKALSLRTKVKKSSSSKDFNH